MMAYRNTSPLPRQSHRTVSQPPADWLRWAFALGCIIFAITLYTALLWRAFPATQTDISGDYAYAAWQMSRGAALYRDVLGQQTPLLYVLGALVYHLWPQPAVFLATALFLRALTVIAVFLLARACCLAPFFSVTAALTYLALPMGFLFDVRFEPNLLITLGGVLCTLALTRLSRRRAILAGLGCGVFILAKLTFAPIVVALAAYLLVTRRPLLLPFLLSALGVLLAGTLIGVLSVGIAFIQGAYLAHAGSTLSIDNFTTAAAYIWRVEGLPLLVALAGALLSARETGPQHLLASYLLGGLATLGATVSVGSLAPEMLAGEPALALCAVIALRHAVVSWQQRRESSGSSRGRLVPLLAVFLILGQSLAVRDDAAALATSRPDAALICMVRLLKSTSPSNAPVIAPPYQAFLAQRPLEDGLSDVFNWSIRVHRGDRTARAQAAAVIHGLRAGQIALVAMDGDHPLPPQVERATVARYTPASVCSGTRVYFAPGSRYADSHHPLPHLS